MKKRTGMLLAVCLALGLLLAGCGGAGGAASGVESAQSAAGSQAAQSAASAASESADGSEGAEGADGAMGGSAGGAMSESSGSAASEGDSSGASGSNGDSAASESAAGTSASEESADSGPSGSAASEADASAGSSAADPAGASAESAAGADADADSEASATSEDAAGASSSSDGSDATSSPKEKADDGLIDVYNFTGRAAEAVIWIPMRIIHASQWADAAAEGDVASAWAYTLALERVELYKLVGKAIHWPYEAKDEPVAGYAIDGQVVYANFGSGQFDVSTSAIFDKNGKVVYLRVYGNENYRCYAFKDDVLISCTGGAGSIPIIKPKVIGEWDEDERLAEQEELLDIVYSNFALLRVDDMETVEEITR